MIPTPVDLPFRPGPGGDRRTAGGCWTGVLRRRSTPLAAGDPLAGRINAHHARRVCQQPTFDRLGDLSRSRPSSAWPSDCRLTTRWLFWSQAGLPVELRRGGGARISTPLGTWRVRSPARNKAGAVPNCLGTAPARRRLMQARRSRRMVALIGHASESAWERWCSAAVSGFGSTPKSAACASGRWLRRSAVAGGGDARTKGLGAFVALGPGQAVLWDTRVWMAPGSGRRRRRMAADIGWLVDRRP
jgi:hypothetical protein